MILRHLALAGRNSLRLTVGWQRFALLCVSLCIMLISAPLGRPALAEITPGVQRSAAQTANITGTVLDNAGRPVVGADVALLGRGTRFATKTGAQGAFIFVGVPFDTYEIVATAPGLGKGVRSNINVSGDIDIAVQFAPATNGPKTLAVISVKAVGAKINVTAASVYSVTPSSYALQGNPSWRELLNQVPGVTVGGNYYGGTSSNVIIPDSPFQPIIISINGALPYETSTTFDGMPISNYTFSSAPGAGIDLSSLPMPLFETADIVRGPGANAPSIVDSVGGSFVLHPPGAVQKNSFELAASNDAWGGYFSNAKAMLRLGRLSATVVYGFNNSPGPYGSGPIFGSLVGPATIDGKAVASGGFIQFVPNPDYVGGSCFCIAQTTILANGGLQTTAWTQHQGGIGLAYQLSPTITAQTFYAGSQAVAGQPYPLETNLFIPGAGYTGPIGQGPIQDGLSTRQ